MKIIAIILFFAVIGGGYYYYQHQQNLQNPLVQYQNIIKLPTAQQAAAFVASAKVWVTDPVDNTPYPKGWQHMQMTVQGKTFTIVTSDSHTPPTYYVSFNFPKSLIASEHLIKCVGTSAAKTTDICLVGDNPEVDAYYNIMAWINNNPLTNTVPTTN